ncbi:Tip20p CYBJADRAFT_191708 [Cyberlindnera jadinii NRRL Y-1542]|uniref:RAD50-interacting protein 1 n=1 Tax=Cyberlindnera jadinii (strain ATCC 18201 / CBS 1600 / BCRC 20928 / JCM 3617 / NBRC 0987 / NRRL Y-1542) TaxID=983966 RepID=A0A1E4RX05_CYBJN|nr:hypothetical protein CYBJADRAFT_191708 [Cyberlindnera jadinii NRRL Y-1542]ODV71822.1 hypothetical protein CYBJADRAFT_191708 [Cyberlindnera jadinii NRRL Y-1542]
MTSFENWFTTVHDVSQVNERIAELEGQRSLLFNKDDDKEDTRAWDLANEIKLAIGNEDVETLNALISTYGEIQALVAAKNLVSERKRLMAQRKDVVLSEDLKKQLTDDTGYNFEQWREVKDQLRQLQDPHLKQTLSDTLDGLVMSHKDDFYLEFVTALHGFNWMKQSALSPELFESFTQLVNLQSLLSNKPKYPDTVWAFDAISQNFRVGFNYHFNSDKQTNRIDKPELFLTYLLTYLSTHIIKINKMFPLADTELNDCSAHTEFITSALVPVRDKLQQFIGILRNSTEEKSTDTDLRLLIHLVKETVNFDELLVNEYFYDPFSDGLWPGLFSCFDYRDLEKWLNLENKYADSNFFTIVDAPNVFQIDYSSVGHDELKPTVSSIKLKYLFESTIKNFQKLFVPNYELNSSLQKFKLKLFSRMFLGFLEMYYKALNDGATAFADLFRKTKSLLHATKGSEVDISGCNGLERLFRLYCSLRYTIKFIKVWDNELIFVELNNLFNKYSNTQTSSLFATILGKYTTLETQVFQLIIQFHTKTIDSLMKKYVALNTWDVLQEPESYAVSGELVPLMDTLPELFDFSVKVVTKHELTKIKNAVSLYLANCILQNVIKGNHFSRVGVKQLALDFTTVWENLQLKRNFPTYYKLVEVFKVLSVNGDEISLYGPYSSVSSYAKSGDFSSLKQDLDLQYLKDGDILDILLRIS